MFIARRCFWLLSSVGAIYFDMPLLMELEQVREYREL
jgi:hypothetical protein